MLSHAPGSVLWWYWLCSERSLGGAEAVLYATKGRKSWVFRPWVPMWGPQRPGVSAELVTMGLLADGDGFRALGGQ